MRSRPPAGKGHRGGSRYRGRRGSESVRERLDLCGLGSGSWRGPLLALLSLASRARNDGEGEVRRALVMRSPIFSALDAIEQGRQAKGMTAIAHGDGF